MFVSRCSYVAFSSSRLHKDFLTNGIGKTRYAVVDKVAWDLAVVVNEMEKLLQIKVMPAQKLVGTDAQYPFIVTR